MTSFGPAALFGLCFGFVFGIGCSLAVMYSIYLGGYRKGIEDSLAPKKSQRFHAALEKIHARRAKSAPRK
jgi:hypothetical protein